MVDGANARANKGEHPRNLFQIIGKILTAQGGRCLPLNKACRPCRLPGKCIKLSVIISDRRASCILNLGDSTKGSRYTLGNFLQTLRDKGPCLWCLSPDSSLELNLARDDIPSIAAMELGNGNKQYLSWKLCFLLFQQPSSTKTAAA